MSVFLFYTNLEVYTIIGTGSDGAYYSYRLFHAGMASPVPVSNGGTGASGAKAALNNLGIMCAIADKKLSSSVGFRGIFKKVLIILLVGVAHIIDLHVVGTGNALRSAVVCFYLSNEGVSLLENAAHLGLPILEKLKTVLQQLHNRDEHTEENTDDNKEEN